VPEAGVALRTSLRAIWLSESGRSSPSLCAPGAKILHRLGTCACPCTRGEKSARVTKPRALLTRTHLGLAFLVHVHPALRLLALHALRRAPAGAVRAVRCGEQHNTR
jgi:hypothetical protein